MTRIPTTDEAMRWVAECDYIARVTDVRGNVSEMNHDLATFVRYCEMQRDAATREGFHDSALYIQECIDDLTGAEWTNAQHDEAVRAETACPPSCPVCGGAS